MIISTMKIMIINRKINIIIRMDKLTNISNKKMKKVEMGIDMDMEKEKEKIIIKTILKMKNLKIY